MQTFRWPHSGAVLLRVPLLLCCLVALLLTSGCADLRDTAAPDPAAGLPPRFSLFNEVAEQTEPWWLRLDSPELRRLIEAGINDNPSIDATWARLRQARAVAAKAGAEKWPALSGSAEAAHKQNLGEGTNNSSESFSAGLFANYELDLWGRVRAESASSLAAAEASRDDAYSAIISLSGQIAETWTQFLIAGQKEQQLLHQLELNGKLLELVEARFRMATVSALDVYQQRQTIAAIEGGLITVRGGMAILRHQLAVLTGRPATGFAAPREQSFPKLEALPPTGLPADLLAHRPDIRAAGLRLRSAEWEIAAAKADRLPALNLNGSLAADSDTLETLLDSWLLRLAASLAGPIFDGGKRQAEVERVRAVAEERLAIYRQTVLTAIQEVENALSAEAEMRKTITNIDLQIDLTQKAFREASFRYLNGLNDFLPVLREQINLITLRLDRIQAEGELVQARITLYRALGGSWPATFEPGAQPSPAPVKEP